MEKPRKGSKGGRTAIYDKKGNFCIKKDAVFPNFQFIPFLFGADLQMKKFEHETFRKLFKKFI